MKENKVYLSGKIRGCADYKSIFRVAEVQVQQMGFETIFNPANNKSKDVRTCFAIDMAWICKNATHIAMIWNWKDSKGAIAEYSLAKALGLPVIFLASKPRSHLKVVQNESAVIPG